jgi:hypothetical protein
MTRFVGVGATGHDDQAEQLSLVEGPSNPQRHETSTPNCSGLQTVAPEPANKGYFRFTFCANKPRLEPTITANEPTFGSWPVLVMWFGSAIRVYINVYV